MLYPWSRNPPRAEDKLNPSAPQLLSLCARARAPGQEKPPQEEAHVPRLERSPHSPQLEKARTQQRRPSAAKNKGVKLLKKECEEKKVLEKTEILSSRYFASLPDK